VLGIFSIEKHATSALQKNLVLPQQKSPETRAFSLPQDSLAELMFELCVHRRTSLSTSLNAGFRAANAKPGPAL
jgi:hypothetical protein